VTIVSDVQVVLDNRVRLVGAVLAASDWPALEQAETPHAVHAQAKFTGQYVMPHQGHPAVQLANRFIAQDVPVADLFQAAVQCEWASFETQAPLPGSFAAGDWVEALADFYVDTAIAAFFWADHNKLWETSAGEIERIVHRSTLPAFLGRLMNIEPPPIQAMPNLTYPSLQSLAVSPPDSILAILPPPRAYGESPPWPYGEEADWVLSQICSSTLQLLLSRQLSDAGREKIELLAHAATALFLEQSLSEADSKAYLVHHRQSYDQERLPPIMDGLREQLQDENSSGLDDIAAHIV
jgi:hypothetical protein